MNIFGDSDDVSTEDYRDSGAAFAYLKTLLRKVERGVWKISNLSIQQERERQDQFSSIRGGGVSFVAGPIISTLLIDIVENGQLEAILESPSEWDSGSGSGDLILESPSPIEPSMDKIIVSAGQYVDNPWAEKYWNITNQGQFVKKYGLDRGNEAARQAMSRVGATKPTRLREVQVDAATWGELQKNSDARIAAIIAKRQSRIAKKVEEAKPKTPTGASPAREVIFE